MPPLTPRTTWRPLIRPGWSDLRLELFERQRVLVDLAQRHRQRLLLHVGWDERADVLEQTLTELGVVGVDLAGSLRRVDDERVLALDLVEQLVDRRVGDALGGSGGAGHVMPFYVRMPETGVAPGYQRLDGHDPDERFGSLRHRCVDHGGVELLLRGQLDLGRREPLLDDIGRFRPP